jgi:hypothetical protein
MNTITIVRRSYEKVPLMQLIRSKPELLIAKDEPEFEKLWQIHDTALTNDLLRDRLIKLKPEHEASYRAQWQKAEDELDAMAAKLIGSFQLEDPEDY